MKRLCAFLCVAGFLLAFPAVAKDKEFPYFFPKGVKFGVTNPLEQFTEFIRYDNATSLCDQPHDGIMPNVSVPGSFGFESPDLVSTSGPRQKLAGQLLIFDQVVEEKKNSFRVSTLCNQYYISGKQLFFARDYIWNQMRLAASEVVAFHAPTEEYAISRRAQELGIPVYDLQRGLDKGLDEFPGITLREVYGIPRVRYSNFIAREVHIAYPIGIPGVLGITWMNAGRIELNPQWGHIDALSGFPKVLGHEDVHAGLQRFPDPFFYDAEWEASLHEAFDSRNKIDVLIHSYMSPFRVFAWGYGNFNVYPFLKETLVDFGGSFKVDPVKYANGLNRLEELKSKFRPVIQKGLGEFRSNQSYWFALNQRLGNGNSVYFVTMACAFNPTLLGGEEKTTAWLKGHELEVREVGDLAESISGGFSVSRTQTIIKQIAQGRPGESLKINDTMDQYLNFEDRALMQFMGVKVASARGTQESPSHINVFIDTGRAKGWTPEQLLAAYLYWFRLRYTKETPQGCLPDYTKIGNEEIAKISAAKITVLNQILSDTSEWKQFIEATGLREDFEHELEIAKAQHEFILHPKPVTEVRLKSWPRGSRALAIKKQ
jgi:hypothetical protein